MMEKNTKKTEMKKCKTCKESKQVTDFYAAGESGKYGANCRECISKSNKRYREATCANRECGKVFKAVSTSSGCSKKCRGVIAENKRIAKQEKADEIKISKVNPYYLTRYGKNKTSAMMVTHGCIMSYEA